MRVLECLRNLKKQNGHFFVYFSQRLPQSVCGLMNACVFVCVNVERDVKKWELSIYLILLLEEVEEETKLNWSAALHVVQRRGAA